ncbi:FUSC family protein [Desulfovibrio inopinatus]|uniref:FUSC family protein n=1 Tax=Desulfovibrio inopinatus TaxID=102109 RepID=UPI00042080BA|nr:FUSC family protein [Desulfovibrio inopinatus]
MALSNLRHDVVGMFAAFRSDTVASRFAVRSTAATVLTLLCAMALGLPNPYWAGFGAFFVSTPGIGFTLRKSVDRVTGTLFGAIAGLLLCQFGAYSWPNLLLSYAMLSTIIVVASAYALRNAYSYIMFSITSYIILGIGLFHPETAYTYAWYRIAETTLGVVIASIFAILVFPGNAGRRLLDLSRDTWSDAASLVELVLEGIAEGKPDHEAIRRLAVSIDQSRTKAEAFHEDARITGQFGRRELQAGLFGLDQAKRLARQLAELGLRVPLDGEKYSAEMRQHIDSMKVALVRLGEDMVALFDHGFEPVLRNRAEADCIDLGDTVEAVHQHFVKHIPSLEMSRTSLHKAVALQELIRTLEDISAWFVVPFPGVSALAPHPNCEPKPDPDILSRVIVDTIFLNIFVVLFVFQWDIPSPVAVVTLVNVVFILSPDIREVRGIHLSAGAVCAVLAVTVSLWSGALFFFVPWLLVLTGLVWLANYIKCGSPACFNFSLAFGAIVIMLVGDNAPLQGKLGMLLSIPFAYVLGTVLLAIVRVLFWHDTLAVHLAGHLDHCAECLRRLCEMTALRLENPERGVSPDVAQSVLRELKATLAHAKKAVAGLKQMRDFRQTELDDVHERLAVYVIGATCFKTIFDMAFQDTAWDGFGSARQDVIEVFVELGKGMRLYDAPSDACVVLTRACLHTDRVLRQLMKDAEACDEPGRLLSATRLLVAARALGRASVRMTRRCASQQSLEQSDFDEHTFNSVVETGQASTS